MPETTINPGAEERPARGDDALVGARGGAACELCGGPASAEFWHVVGCIALVLLVGGVFSNALWNDFVDFDDYYLVIHNTRIRSLGWDEAARIFFYRNPQGAWLPLREASYAMDYALWGLNAFGFHLTNLVLHTANVLLVYALMNWLLRRGVVAWLAAALFAVHPVQVAAVTWVAGRRDVLYGLFFLLSVLAFVSSGRRRRTGQGWEWHYAASLVCLAVALLAKASAMMLPGVLLLIVVLLEGGDEPLLRRVARCVPHGVVAAALVGIHFWVGHQAGVVKGQMFGQRLASMPWTFASYWRLLFLPVHLATPHGRVPIAWSEVGTIVGASAVVVGVLVLVWWAAPRRTLALFCVGWWFVMLLPFSNLVPLSMLIAERYLYLPILGACAFGAHLVGSLARGRRGWLVWGCAGIVLVGFAVQTHSRNRVWVGSRRFWHDSVSKYPSAPVPRIGLAAAYVDTNSPEAAWDQYMKVARVGGIAYSLNNEHLELVRVGIMQCYDRTGRAMESRGRMAEALDVYRTTVRMIPQEVAARVKLTEAFERRGLLAEAIEQIGHIQELDASYPGLAAWRERLEARKMGAQP